MARLITMHGLNCWVTSALLTRRLVAHKYFHSGKCLLCVDTLRSSNTTKRYRPRRAVLYVPGSDEKKILKIPGLRVDCAVMDCEDGVAQNKKIEARHTIRKILDKQEFQFGRTERGVRINSIDSGLADDDIKEIFQAKRLPESIAVPKVENISHVDWVADRLNRFGRRDNHSDQDTVRVILMIESARALLNLERICQRAEDRFSKTPFILDALIFGSDDFCASIGATRSKEAREVLYARQHFVLVAKAFSLQAIDMVYIDYKDNDGLHEQSVEGAQMGFTGKQVIHPGQIPIVQNVFLPSPQKIEWATELIKAFEAHQKFGEGAFTFRDSMIDMPSVLQAKNIVQLSAYILAEKCT